MRMEAYDSATRAKRVGVEPHPVDLGDIMRVLFATARRLGGPRVHRAVRLWGLAYARIGQRPAHRYTPAASTDTVGIFSPNAGTREAVPTPRGRPRAHRKGPSMLLQGKTAVVTGGSRGIGLAIVKRFLAEGANVALCGSRPETAQKAVDAILSENPDAPVMGLSPDLTDEAAVEAAFASAKERFGGLDIVCNNAGISQSTPLGRLHRRRLRQGHRHQHQERAERLPGRLAPAFRRWRPSSTRAPW